MHHRIVERLAAALVLVATIGCDEGDVGAPADDVTNETPVLSVELDEAACRDAVRVELVATLFGCVGFGPCTLPTPRPTFRSGAFDCTDATDGEILRLPVDRKGLYRVELVATRSDDSQTRWCHGIGDTPEVAIDQRILDERPTLTLENLGQPCPPVD